MKCLKKVLFRALVLIFFPIDVVFSGLAGLIFGVGSAFKALADAITGEIE